MSLHPGRLLTENDQVSVAQALQHAKRATVWNIIVVVHVEQITEHEQFNAARCSFEEHQDLVLARA